GFRFSLPNGVARSIPTLAAVQKVMGGLMNQYGEMVGRRQAGQERDLAARGHASGRSDGGVVFERDVPAGDELDQTLVISFRVAFHRGELRQRLAIGLADIEHM